MKLRGGGETGAEVRPIAILIPRRRDSFIHLIKMDAVPWDQFSAEIAEHEPRRSPAADGEMKGAVGRDRLSGLLRDQNRCFMGNLLGGGENALFHGRCLRIGRPFAAADNGRLWGSCSVNPGW